MPRRYLKFAEGHFYHVYNRGVNKHKIFFEADNYTYLLKLAKKNVSKFNITIIAYCLMPNHFHFLMRLDDNADLSTCISNTLNSYVQAINKKYRRSGAFFHERFKAIHVDQENYLVHLCRYIHLNPLKANLIFDLRDWPFSNYLEFVGGRTGSLFDREFFRAYFSDAEQYRDFVDDQSSRPPNGFENYTID